MKRLTRAFRPSFFWTSPGLLASLLLLGSCIEIREELAIKSDRSGTYRIEVDAGQLAGLLLLTGAAGDEEIRAGIAMIRDAGSRMRKAKGISNVLLDTLIGDGSMGLSFDFSDPARLNKALYLLGEVEKKFYYPSLYKIGSRSIKRRNIAPVLRMQVRKEYPELLENAFLESIELISTCRVSGDLREARGNQVRQRSQEASFSWNMKELLSTDQGLGYKLRYSKGATTP
ncbi:MAG: hypothetical protein IH599_01730 [Bacteroidales bacterium]|nr:hypothetical protein [Bacteroidales bacterium]